MKAVMLSIRPQWCELIASSEKTLEVRKNKPKLETPFKVYIYCTKSKPGWFDFGKKVRLDGQVIGEFVCDFIEQVTVWNKKYISTASCLPLQVLYYYAGDKSVYDLCGWHISKLKIYDKPKLLSDFFAACRQKRWTDCSRCKELGEDTCKQLTRPPQSWCYVEEA